MKKYITGCVSFLALLFIDQWTKWLACLWLKPTGEYKILGDLFVLQYLENRGAAFGILQNKRIFLLLLTLVILFLLIFLYIKIPGEKKYTPLRIADVLLAAGAVGNMIDRFIRSFVVDFLYVKVIRFPVFNVADCYVVIAAITALLLVSFYYSEEDLAFFRMKKKK